jgi:Asparagine synthase/Glutamine amidotransferase domain
MISQPGFWGVVGNVERATRPPCGASPIWLSVKRGVTLYVNSLSDTACSWHSIDRTFEKPAVFVFGSPTVGSDSDFGPDSIVTVPNREERPDRIAELYEKDGLDALGCIDGDFSIVIHEPAAQRLVLAVDKFGCDDIFFRVGDGFMLFASHPAYLLESRPRLDPLALAFFLAQEAFIPAPYTFADSVKSLGRARYMSLSYRTGLQIKRGRYWQPRASWRIDARTEAISHFSHLLENSVALNTGERTGLLLSGGVDSTLIGSIAAAGESRPLLAATWKVNGFGEDEAAVAKAKRIAAALALPHITVPLNSDDESLPEEWDNSVTTWMTGSRLTLPLWLRLGAAFEERLGPEFCALSGQMADTMADNNYTLQRPGYWLRRILFSSWLLELMPLLQRAAPSKYGKSGRSLVALADYLAGARFAGILESVLDGMTSRSRFYQGRVFGYGEFPGLAPAYFPILKKDAFDQVACWYASNFLEPILTNLAPQNFYSSMIELSLDMVMLHLDSRLVFHAFRANGGRAHLPFLDARVMNFFCSIPYSARAFYRQPKDLIRSQPLLKAILGEASQASERYADRRGATGVEELLLRGSLGTHFGELLKAPSFLSLVPELLDFVDEAYLTGQLSAFRAGRSGVDYKLIGKIVALERWVRSLQLSAADGLRDQPVNGATQISFSK